MKVVFCTSSVHERDRLDLWRYAASKVGVWHEFRTSAGSAFEGSISAGMLGPLSLALFECEPCSARRTPQCITRGGDDELLLMAPLAGSLLIEQDGRDDTAGPGDFLLVDPRRPASLDIFSQTRLLLVKVPREALQDRLGDIGAIAARTISATSPVGALASGFLAMLPSRCEDLGSTVGEKVAHQLIELIALAFSVDAADRPASLSPSRMATLLRLKGIIEYHLRDPDLRPASVAANAGISVRYANALLAGEGTSLERYIVARRLELCRKMLEDPSHATRTIGDIAYTSGFSNVSHFSRRFKARFGVSPSECRPRLMPELPARARPERCM
jgi:AraC family transcriptional regulator, positive regulator of tynA and feaB